MYTGIGYDVHRFEKGRPLFLGGVRIAHPLGLKGHSDADVLIHALMDALLGACGKPDIGTLFPNTDSRYKNASSVKLLETVALILKKGRFIVNNVDITVIAEQPKINLYTARMKQVIAAALDISAERVGIKATTNEKLGFIGRGEGIAAMATASVTPKAKKKKKA